MTSIPLLTNRAVISPGKSKCLIQFVLLKKRLPIRPLKYRYQTCKRPNSVSAIASLRANGNLT